MQKTIKSRLNQIAARKEELLEKDNQIDSECTALIGGFTMAGTAMGGIMGLISFAVFAPSAMALGGFMALPGAVCGLATALVVASVTYLPWSIAVEGEVEALNKEEKSLEKKAELSSP